MGFPDCSVGKKIHLLGSRSRLDSQVTKIHWRRDRLPTPVFWPGKFHGLCSPWGCKEMDKTEWLSLSLQPWIFIGRTDAKAPILWPPDAKSRLIGKDSEAGKDWGQEKGVTEDEMVGWHHQLNGHECEHSVEDGKGQGSLACCSPKGRKESDTT